MQPQKLTKARWAEFFDTLSEKVEAADILIAHRAEGEDEAKLQSASLLSMSYDKKSDELDVMLFGEDLFRTGLKTVEVEYDDDDLTGLEIVGKDKLTCLIRFNHPIHLPRAALAA